MQRIQGRSNPESELAGAYSASKAAVHVLHEALRMELAPLGVQVISVQLAAVLTALIDKSNFSQLQSKCAAWHVCMCTLAPGQDFWASKSTLIVK